MAEKICAFEVLQFNDCINLSQDELIRGLKLDSLSQKQTFVDVQCLWRYYARYIDVYDYYICMYIFHEIVCKYCLPRGV